MTKAHNDYLTPLKDIPTNSKIIVGISGGVDSSVSALLLLQAGFDVHGVFMKNWQDTNDANCTAEQDAADAQAVCTKLGIPLNIINFSNEYWDRVFSYFLQEYQAGRTPNPDILCNKEIKFKAFLDYAMEQGADYIATGHYAQGGALAHDTNYPLTKGHDTNKDQSYFLHALSKQQLSKAIFPLGHIDKPTVRDLARQNGLITHNKKDSTGICFIGERKFTEFLKTYLPAKPGDIATTNGQIIGQHQGLMYHTIGQRKGLGIGGLADQDEQPWFVVKKDLENNKLVVAQGTNNPSLFKSELLAEQTHWINGQAPALPFICKAKTRYRQPDQNCTITSIPSNNTSLEHHNTSTDLGRDINPNIASNNISHIKVVFDEPQRAITPGQSVVFYDDDICLGGAVIT